jgi:hypothetical protein
MWGRLNPLLGWQYRGLNGKLEPFILYDLRRNSGMLSGIGTHSGVLATRPLQDFDLLSIDGKYWRDRSHLLALVPQEACCAQRRHCVPLHVRHS